MYYIINIYVGGGIFHKLFKLHISELYFSNWYQSYKMKVVYMLQFCHMFSLFIKEKKKIKAQYQAITRAWPLLK